MIDILRAVSPGLFNAAEEGGDEEAAWRRLKLVERAR